MPKTLLTWFVAILLMLGSFIQPLSAQVDGQVASVESVRIKIERLGVGENAKATIRLKTGGKIKGYVSQAGEENFVLRDRKTDAPTTIRYADVLKVEENKGHSTARNVGIGVAVGVGAVLAVVGLLIASLD
jgi:hypothetical protein